MGSKIGSIQSVIIRLCSPEEIRSLSSGEITKAETLNYRKMKPKEGGLFCESIFGPTKGWSCACGKLRMSEQRKPTVCSVCGTEVVSSAFRETRIGHIELNVPIAHPWFVSGHPSILGNLLGISSKSLARILHASCYLVNWVDEEACRREIDRLHAVTRDQERETGKKINAEILAILRERNQKIASLQAAKETLQNGLDSRFSQRAAKVTEEAGQIEDMLRQLIRRAAPEMESAGAGLAENQEKRLKYQSAMAAEKVAAAAKFHRKQVELREQGSSALKERLEQLEQDAQKIEEERAYEEAVNNTQKVQLHNRFNFHLSARLDDIMAEGCRMESFLKAHLGESFPQELRFECAGKVIAACGETIAASHVFSVMNMAGNTMAKAEKLSLLEFQDEIAQNRRNEEIIRQKYQAQIAQTVLERKACLKQSGTEEEDEQLRTAYDSRLKAIAQDWAPRMEALDRELEALEQERQREEQTEAFLAERFRPKADGSGMEYARDLVLDACGTVLAKAGESVSTDVLAELERVKQLALDEIQRNAETEIRRQQEALDAQIESLRQQAEEQTRDIRESFESQQFDVPDQDLAAIECLETLQPLALLSVSAYRRIRAYSPRVFRADSGAEALADVLGRIDLEALREELPDAIRSAEEPGRKQSLIRRLNIVEAFLSSGVRPEWMILTVLPVLPPAFRPIFRAKNQRIITSDLNDLYLLVLRRNKEMRQLSECGAPEMILLSAKRGLQDAVDCLFGCGSTKALKGNFGSRRLFTLKGLLSEGSNPFCRNSRERTVDYALSCRAGRDERIPLTAISLPYETALRLYQPFLLEKIMECEYAQTIYAAKTFIQKRKSALESLLREALQDRPILVSHQGRLQAEMRALKPILSAGDPAGLNPVTAELLGLQDGEDEVQLYLPLSERVCAELERQGLSSPGLSNVIPSAFPENGRSSAVLGLSFLTTFGSAKGKTLPVCGSMAEAIQIFEMGGIELREPVSIRGIRQVCNSHEREQTDEAAQLVLTTAGRILFNQCLPEECPFINERLDGKKLNQLLLKLAWRLEEAAALAVCEALQRLGIRYAAACESNDDSGAALPCYLTKESFCNDYALAMEARSMAHTWELRLPELLARLIHALSEVTVLGEDCGTTEGIWVLRNPQDSDTSFASDLCGSVSAIEIIDTTSGQILAKEGELIDYAAALEIARSAVPSVYLRSPSHCEMEQGICAHCYGADLRRLKGAAEGLQAGMIAARQIGKGLESLVREMRENPHLAGQREKSLIRILECLEADSISGHSALLAKIDGTVHIQPGKATDGTLSLRIEQRSLHTEHYGIPEGWQIKISDLQLIHQGEIIAEHQGETLCAGQTGGVRINGRSISITSVDQQQETCTIANPAELIVSERQHVQAGEALTRGDIDPHDILRINGLEACRDFLLEEFRKNLDYKVQSKHLEILVRKMTEKVMIDDPGDSAFLPGTCVERITLQKCNEKLLQDGKTAVQSRDILLGISEIAQHSASWMQQASLDAPIPSLLFAAIQGKSDPLSGIEERLIAGRSFTEA